MAVKIGSKLKVEDYEGHWVDGVVVAIHPKMFYVDGGGHVMPFRYHEHKQAWFKPKEFSVWAGYD